MGSPLDEARYVYDGVVTPGDRRGRLLGYPTINVEGGTAAADGVWAGRIRISSSSGSDVHVAAISIGRRPTYYGPTGMRLIEAHVLDFSRDVYGCAVRIECCVFLRRQLTFDGSDDLIRQLDRDVADVRLWAAGPDERPLRMQAAEASRSSRGRGWGPNQRKQQRDLDASRRRRELVREEAIAEAVEACTSIDQLSHSRIAEITRLPLGYLEHRYPSIADLIAVGCIRHDA